MSDIKQRIAKEAQEIEMDCVRLSEAHYQAAGRRDRINLTLGIPATVLAGPTSVTALSEIAGNNRYLVTGILAIVVASLSALITFLNPSDQANNHKSASANYDALRVKASLLKDIELSADYANLDASTKEIIKQLKEIANQFTTLSQSSLRVPRSIQVKTHREVLSQPQNEVAG
jgi:MoxR-like ATPase